MKTKRNFSIRVISLFLLCCILISGCNSTQKNRFECLGNEKPYAFAQDQWTQSKPTPTLVSPEYSSWELIYEDQNLGNPEEIISRGKDQLWILGSKLFLYSKLSTNLTQYFVYLNGIEDTPQTLFLSKDGTLWAMGSHLVRANTFLSRFNDKTSKFEPVLMSQGLFSNNSTGRGEIVEDSNNRLWMLVFGEGIFVFDPKTTYVKKVLPQTMEDKSIISSMAIDANNDLWFATSLTGFYRHLLYYDVQDDKLSVLRVGISEEDVINGILIDKENRLWISDYAYWNIDSPFPKEGYTGLNIIIRSSVFVTKRYPFNDYKWIRPKVLTEDSDGNIWYTGFGLIRFNPNSGEWCKVLDSDSLVSGITEDNQGYFWTILDGKIYKHY